MCKGNFTRSLASARRSSTSEKLKLATVMNWLTTDTNLSPGCGGWDFWYSSSWDTGSRECQCRLWMQAHLLPFSTCLKLNARNLLWNSVWCSSSTALQPTTPEPGPGARTYLQTAIQLIVWVPFSVISYTGLKVSSSYVDKVNIS